MSNITKVVLIADTFPPLRNSGAVQLRDLSNEFVKQGYSITVLLPDSSLSTQWALENEGGMRILRLKTPKIKDVNYIRRALGEILMPFVMKKGLKASPLYGEKFDGVVWYSPSIFLSPLAKYLKKLSSCKSYLILRDVFPDWAVDMGLMRKGLIYYFFKSVAKYQYSVADVIGVQSPGNRVYLENWAKTPGRSLEVLQNWLSKPVYDPSPIRVSETSLADRKIFIYAGNMGIAQGMDIIIQLVSRLSQRLDVGFIFVGRGSESVRLKKDTESLNLTNVLFFDEVHPDQIPDLYSQCDFGIVALDPRHKSHNIPGKFITYMQNGLPVLANVNKGNDLAVLIRQESVGQVCESNSLEKLEQMVHRLVDEYQDQSVSIKCKRIFDEKFAVENTVRQITSALSQ